MATQVNLRGLVVERPEKSARAHTRRRKWGIRYGIPLAILLSFGALLGWSIRETFLPSTRVTVTPVILTKADVQQAGAPLFQAAGWVEPRPLPTVVSAQVEGIVESLLINEGQEVAADQPLAKLIDTDAQLAVAEAQATLRLRDAEVELANATLTAARTSFENPAHLEAALAEAEAQHAKVVSELRDLPFALKAAEARLQIAAQELEGKRSVADAVSQRAVQRAQSEFDAASAAVSELQEQRVPLENQVQGWGRKCAALQKQLELKTDELRALHEAQAGLKIAQARRQQAQLAVDSAQVRRQRMVIRSPMAGRVLAIHTGPGQRLAGLSPASERDASAVVSLYDPYQLQVRADVRLENVPQIQLGQTVEIEASTLAAPLSGEVIAVTSQADIQKNTLQVKIAIDDPPAVIRPEMLVQVTFLSMQQVNASADKHSVSVFVPRTLVQGGKDTASVWIADVLNNRAKLQSIKLGRAGTSELVEVVEGVAPTTKLIVSGREDLRSGERIQVVGEDSSLGATVDAR